MQFTCRRGKQSSWIRRVWAQLVSKRTRRSGRDVQSSDRHRGKVSSIYPRPCRASLTPSQGIALGNCWRPAGGESLNEKRTFTLHLFNKSLPMVLQPLASCRAVRSGSPGHKVRCKIPAVTIPTVKIDRAPSTFCGIGRRHDKQYSFCLGRAMPIARRQRAANHCWNLAVSAPSCRSTSQNAQDA